MAPYGSEKQFSLIAALSKAGIIDEQKATFCLNMDQGFGTGSNVTFGSASDDCMLGGSDNVHTLELDTGHKDWWTVRMRAL